MEHIGAQDPGWEGTHIRVRVLVVLLLVWQELYAFLS